MLVYWLSRVVRPLRIVHCWRAKLTMGSYGCGLIVSRRSRLTPQTHVQNNVSFNGMTVQGYGELQISDNFRSGTDCLIITSNHNYLGSILPYDSTHVLKPVIIRRNVWIGSRVTIIGSVEIGEGAIVQAGAVVVRDVPACAVVGGNPAEVIKMRDCAHYSKLSMDQQR